MLKAGIIFGVIGFVLVLLVSLGSPLCSVCFTLFLGLGAGYVAGNYDRPLENSEALRMGGIAGALTGGLMIPGQLIAAVINANSISQADLAALSEMFGVPAADASLLLGAQIIAACCLGIVNLAVLAGTGAGGGAIWFSRNRGAGKPSDPIPPAL